jgi:hypothetical protein
MVLLVEVGHRKAVRRPEVERDCRLEELDQCTLEDMVDTEEM